MDKDLLESLRVGQINTLDLSPDGQECYGYLRPTNEEVVNKINELIDKHNYLIELIQKDIKDI